jgi:hypothetical protein
MPTIVNLTPHAITIPDLPVSGMEERADWTLAPSGTIARAAETIISAPPIGDIPTSYMRYGAAEGIPEPTWSYPPNPCDEPGAVPEGSSFCLVCGAQDGHHAPPRAPAVYYVVSTLAAEAARHSGRTLADLLVPGQQIRDEAGRIVGCRSLARVG